jgi:hypothetical protein
MVAAALVLLTMRRTLRNRRLLEGTPDDRIAGAWAELSDALRLAGRPMPSHLAATEAAAYAKEPPPPRRTLLRRATPDPVLPGAGAGSPAPGFGAVPAAPSPAATAGWPDAPTPSPGPAAGSPDAPAPPLAPAAPLPPLGELVAGINTVGFAPGAADDAQASRAGQQAVAYAAALRARHSWWRRIWWSIHPGPLRWHRD